jgi:methanogenic corrinoid protein MtbC1
VTEAFATQIGADGFAPDASSATRKVRELLS